VVQISRYLFGLLCTVPGFGEGTGGIAVSAVVGCEDVVQYPAWARGGSRVDIGGRMRGSRG
jgi:hypothetical protein